MVKAGANHKLFLVVSRFINFVQITYIFRVAFTSLLHYHCPTSPHLTIPAKMSPVRYHQDSSASSDSTDSDSSDDFASYDPKRSVRPATLAMHADDSLNLVDDVAPPLHLATTFRYAKNPAKLIPAVDAPVSFPNRLFRVLLTDSYRPQAPQTTYTLGYQLPIPHV